jgi:hypothetical protein
MTWHASFRSVALPVLLTVAGLGPHVPAAETRFRVENKVFVGGEKEPRIRSTTIFYDGVVYDYLEDPAEVTILDTARGRFVLLDRKRQIKTELTTGRVADFTKRLRKWAQGQSDPFLKFLADPQFDEQFDEATGQLSFASPWMTYRLVTVEADSRDISRRYREFSDWYCQLNALLTPGTRPPFARLIVNAALERRQRFPREVHLSLRPKKGPLAKRSTARSEHLLVRQLVESDLGRIAQTDQFMATYTAVDFAEYQRRVAR